MVGSRKVFGRYLEGIDFHESLSLVVIVQLDVKIVLHGVFWIRGCIWNNQNGWFIITTRDLFANSKNHCMA